MNKKHMHRNRKAKRIALTAAGVVAAGVLLGVGTAYNNVRTAANNMYAYAANEANDGRDLNTLINQKKAINLMLVGVDGRGDADAVMMMAINPQTNSSKIVSIPNNKKLNGETVKSVYARGGVSATMKALNDTYKTPVDSYMTVDLTGLQKAVDKVGGIEVNGRHMNGQQAVDFARNNNNKDDYSATVLPVFKGLLSKAGSFSTLFNKSFLDTVSNDIQTGLNFDQLTKVGMNYGHAAQNSTSSVAGADNAVVAKTINDELK